ncbi:MFS transporter small subunit [Streptomyces sp. NPDC055134]
MTQPQSAASPPSRRALTLFAWLWVGVPLAYGLYELVQKARQLFAG